MGRTSASEEPDSIGSDNPMRGIWFGLLFSAACWAIIIYLLVGCQTATPSPAVALKATVTPAPASLQPRAVNVYPSTACKPKHGANPIVYVPDQHPAVGGSLKATFFTAYCPPRRSYTWVFNMSDRLLATPVELTSAGAPGCQLQVPIGNTFFVVPGQTVGAFRSVGGSVDMNMLVTQPMSGHRFYIQGGILAPGENQVGLLVTSAVEFWIP
jgi:hypothetical protein